ncbi:hypothetical protein Dda_7580 [Drechslerella dactyloides]|uniref:Uncharacterized protein n=1 Tax=Drechslerella dactyloides TaxID=74499 RepID=A0AAD6IVZ0_DREDA|nr:hypothetical protein Dda_7580 [Drechslerella dactyloides]
MKRSVVDRRNGGYSTVSFDEVGSQGDSHSDSLGWAAHWRGRCLGKVQAELPVWLHPTFCQRTLFAAKQRAISRFQARQMDIVMRNVR